MADTSTIKKTKEYDILNCTETQKERHQRPSKSDYRELS